MSNKPLKKTDREKGWIKERRSRIIKAQLEYHLIICEGSKTEPNYFTGIKNAIHGRNREKIKIEIQGKGKGTTNLLQEALKEVQRSANYISHVWIVYDKDEFTDESFEAVIEKCQEINRQGDTQFHPIWSNECIEIWMLLHFIKIDTPISRKNCVKKVNEQFKKNKIGEYKKNDRDIFEKTRPYLLTAIENAKWLEKKYTTEKPSQQNPCTKVYELVEILNKYI